MKTSLLLAIAMGFSSTAFAQTAGKPGRPGESAGAVTAERKCAAMTGAKKEQCLRDARRMPDSTARRPAIQGSCDALIGPEKELCVKRGGTIEAGAASGAGATAGGRAK